MEKKANELAQRAEALALDMGTLGLVSGTRGFSEHGARVAPKITYIASL